MSRLARGPACRRHHLRGALAFLVAALLSPASRADMVVLKTGEVFMGKVLRSNADEVSIQLESGGVLSFRSSRVERVSVPGQDPSLEKALEKVLSEKGLSGRELEPAGGAKRRPAAPPWGDGQGSAPPPAPAAEPEALGSFPLHARRSGAPLPAPADRSVEDPARGWSLRLPEDFVPSGWAPG